MGLNIDEKISMDGSQLELVKVYRLTHDLYFSLYSLHEKKDPVQTGLYLQFIHTCCIKTKKQHDGNLSFAAYCTCRHTDLIEERR